MIECTINEKGELVIDQRDVSPTVYLDHWALRKLSEDQTLATRLTAVLESRNGTLALSWVNLAEFTREAHSPASTPPEKSSAVAQHRAG